MKHAQLDYRWDSAGITSCSLRLLCIWSLDFRSPVSISVNFSPITTLSVIILLGRTSVYQYVSDHSIASLVSRGTQILQMHIKQTHWLSLRIMRKPKSLRVTVFCTNVYSYSYKDFYWKKAAEQKTILWVFFMQDWRIKARQYFKSNAAALLILSILSKAIPQLLSMLSSFHFRCHNHYKDISPPYKTVDEICQMK